MTALRAHDSDFVGSPGLVNLATLIATNYTGNWDAMIAVKSRLLSGRDLDARSARAVLNMALANSEMSLIWGDTIRAGIASARQSYNPPAQKRKVAKVTPIREVNRRFRVDAPVRFKRRYAMADVKNAVAHLPDPARSYVGWETREFHPQTDEHFADRVAVLHAWWYCGKPTQSKGPNGYGRDMLMFDVIPDGRHACRKCLEVEAEGGPKPRRYEFQRPSWTAKLAP